MGVHIYKARGNQQAAGVDLLRARAEPSAHGSDAAVLHGHVAFPERRPRSVGDGAAAEH